MPLTFITAFQKGSDTYEGIQVAGAVSTTFQRDVDGTRDFVWLSAPLAPSLKVIVGFRNIRDS